MAESIHADVIIVGAGFSGCLALHYFRQRGLSVKIIEAGSDFGGTWHFNRYPGVRVDAPVPMYQLDLPESWDGFRYPQKYPDGSTIRDYFAYLDKRLEFRRDTVFQLKVTEAKYDTDTEQWHFTTDKGITAQSRFAVFAVGSTLKAYFPEYPKFDSFTGTTVHSAAWKEDLDLKGKRVALIGLGASGIQILQEVAKEDCELTAFVRTPGNMLPMQQGPLSQEEQEASQPMYPEVMKMAKYNDWFDYPSATSQAVRFHDTTPEQRDTLLEALWEEGGLTIMNNTFAEVSFDREANACVYDFWAKKARARMQDTAKADIVAPLKQPTWFAGKRPPLEQDYFEMIDRPNVKVVDVKATPIKEFAANGIVTAAAAASGDGNDNPGNDTLHEFDVVIFATGYDTVTGSLYDMNILDKNGKNLQTKWADRIRTYLGLMVPGMPNAFFMYGPQAPTSFTFAPPFLHLEIDWMLGLLDKMDKEQVWSVDVTDDAAETWAQKNWDFYETVPVLTETDSWWVGTNIPGKKREPLLWTGGMSVWWKECVKSLEEWPTNFILAQAKSDSSRL